MSGSSIAKNVIINAPPETIFDVLTHSEHIVHYFPIKEVISEWKQGGELLLKGEVNGEAFTDYGVITVLNRPNEFTYRYWSDNHGTERVPENYLTISYQLTRLKVGTELEVIQSNFISSDMFHAMDEVWDSLLDGLKRYVNNLSP